ncbi:hypothetical protein LMIY3S_02732 [Labrys miyagiensis]
MLRRVSGLMVLGVLVAASPAAWADGLPKQVGQCVETRIKELGSRLEGVADSGSAVVYENGIYGVSYEMEAALRRARVGDRIKLCLASVPKGCPPGDERGKEYKATDLRTHRTWTLPDAEHMCGGA